MRVTLLPEARYRSVIRTGERLRPGIKKLEAPVPIDYPCPFSDIAQRTFELEQQRDTHPVSI
jgi:hypothetical protein